MYLMLRMFYLNKLNFLPLLGGLLLFSASFFSNAACDFLSPGSNQTTTCSTTAPNPDTTPVTAQANSQTVTVNIENGAGLTVAVQNAVSIDADSIINNYGTINLTGDNLSALYAQESGNLLNNVGVLSVSGDNTTGMSVSSAGNTLTNQGMISTQGYQGYGLQANGGGNTLTNSGTIETTGEGGNGINTALGGGVIDTITNTNVIHVSGSNANGIYLGQPASVTNSATGIITSDNSRGIVATAGGTINNAGEIHALRDGIYSYFGAATVINSGTVTSVNESGIQFDSNDAATVINSGSISGGNGVAVRFSDANDQFIWQNSGSINGSVIMGNGDDSATLKNLNASQLISGIIFDGGMGNDTLTLDHSFASDPSRFIDWESIALSNGSQLAINNPLILGDSGSQTGQVTIDATSSLLAGGQSAATISAFNSASEVTVRNAGTLDLTNGTNSTTDRLTINGNYVGVNGTLKLQTVLNGDNSPSDRLIISGGQASGTTQIQVINVGGTGLATQQNGILLVDAINGATTTTTAFNLAGGSVSAGAYDYFLFRGGAGNSDGWFLRNTLISVPPVTPPTLPLGAPPVILPVSPPVTPPTETGAPPVAPSEPVGAMPPVVAAAGPSAPMNNTNPVPLYRQEVPLYQALAPLVLNMGLAQIGTFHQRQGNQYLLSAADSDDPTSWARILGTHSQQRWSGTTSPSFDGSFEGFQVGQDLYSARDAEGGRDNAGLFYGYTKVKGDVKGFILGQPDARAGNMTLNGNSLGGYWTHQWSNQAYVDAVLMQTWMNGSMESGRERSADAGGKLWSASLESGYPVPVSERWSIEPQAQLALQRIMPDDSNDGISSIKYSNDTVETGRVGAHLEGSYGELARRIQPYLNINVWHEFDTTSSVNLNGDRVSAEEGSTSLEVGVGVAATLNKNVSFYSSASHTGDLDSTRTDDYTGSIGMRVIW